MSSDSKKGNKHHAPKLTMIACALVAALFATSPRLVAAQEETIPMPVVPADISLMKQDGAYIFKTNDGLALYTFDRDPPGASVCNGECTTSWPPVPATEKNTPLGDWTIIRREDGSLQWAYKNKPVYTFARDSVVDITGDGVGGVWHLLHP